MWVRRFIAEPDCTFCPLHNCPRVPPEGDSEARIAFVGEGPGEIEEIRGRPFVGPSGQLLDWLLDRAGKRRKDVWITNAACCMPQSVEVDAEECLVFGPKRTLQESTQVYCRPRLLHELALVRPKVVLAVGGKALQSLTGHPKILARHGAIHAVDLQWLAAIGGDVSQAKIPPDLSKENVSYVIPMLHPSALLRGEARQTQAILDTMEKAFRIVKSGVQSEGRFLLVSPDNPRGVDCINDFEGWTERLLASGQDVAIDVETDMEDARKATLTVVGFGSEHFNLGIAVSLLIWDPVERAYKPAWPPALLNRIQRCIRRFLRSSLKKWFWNINFDQIVLERYYGELAPPLADGIHWHWLKQPDTHHNLAWSCQSVLDIPAWKKDYWTKQDAGVATNRDLGIYNAQDSLYTAKVVPHLRSAVYRRRNEHLVDHQMYMAKMARKAHEVGVPIDMAVWTRLYGEYQEIRDGALTTLRRAVKDHERDLTESVHQQRIKRAQQTCALEGRTYKEPDRWCISANDLNPNSEYHMRWFLYDHLGLPIERWTPGGESGIRMPATSYKGVLNHLANPLVKAYVEYHEYAAPLERLDEMKERIDPVTGRIHPNWNVTGQAGPRWASSGVNFQNLDDKLKLALVAEPGYCWVYADAAQLELRILACFAGVNKLLALFNKEPFDEDGPEGWKKYDPAWDAHSLVATLVYGDYYVNAPLKEKKKLRTLVKRVVYGMNYGAGGERIWVTLLEDRRLAADLRASLAGPEGKKQVNDIYTGFHAYLPEVNKWSVAEIALTTHRGYQVWPPLQRRRYWPVKDLEGPKIRNTPIQGAAGDVVNVAFRKMDEEIEAKDIEATMTIHGHDACNWYVRTDQADAVKDIVNRHFDTWLPGPRGPVHIYGQAKIAQVAP